MSRIPQSTIDEVLARADIESVVGKYVSFTKRTGQNLLGLCPFHSEKTPSFTVSPQKQIFKCFGCQKYGNSIGFIMEIEKLSFPEAVKFLGDQYGVPVEWNDRDDDGGSELKDRKKRVLNILTDAAGFYYKTLNSDAGKAARDYAAKRQLSKNTLIKFGIGYAPEGFDNLYRYLKNKGYDDNDLKDSGLFTTSKKGNLIDLFRGRLMVPIFDAFGKIVAFGGRNLGPELPKYVNSPDSLVYKKQNHLYALNFAKLAKSPQLIIVEGYMDAIAMHQAGVNNAVAALGTAFTDSQLKLASKYAQEVVFFFDSDKAGKSAALRASKMMLSYLRRVTGIKIRIRIAAVPNGKDPDEYIKTDGVESFKAVVKSAKDVNDYLFSRAYDDNYDDASGLDQTGFQEDIVTYGSWLYDPIKREKMAAQAAQYLGARAETIVSAMEHAEDETIKMERNVDKRDQEREESAEVKMRRETSKSDPKADVVTRDEMELFVRAVRIGAALGDKSKVDREDVIRKNDFTGKNMREAVEFFLMHFDEKRGVSEAALVGKLSEMLLNGIKAEIFYMRMCEAVPFELTPEAEIDKYKQTLYHVRAKVCSREMLQINGLLGETSDEETRKKLMRRREELDSYYQRLQERSEAL
ncbi:MAG: DNA primase [Clostridiales bacterium]|nr:DNA primase [Clostridiales bacterium]